VSFLDRWMKSSRVIVFIIQEAVRILLSPASINTHTSCACEMSFPRPHGETPCAVTLMAPYS